MGLLTNDVIECYNEFVIVLSWQKCKEQGKAVRIGRSFA